MPAETPSITADDLQRRVLWRDASVLIIDKPAGLPVHAGPKGGPHLTRLLPALAFGLPRPPELAHRLDRETAGCLVLGRHPRALARLGDLFKTHAVRKTYWAVVEGGPEGDEGEIDLPLAPRDPTRGWWMKVDPAGRPSLTTWRVIGRGAGRTLLALEPVTGRTHQLRVHCAAAGFPILGDAIYGTAPRVGGEPLHLLARSIVVPFDPRKEPITATAPVPNLMRAAIEALRGDVTPP